MQRAMWMGTIPQARSLLRVSLALTAVYALAIAVAFYPSAYVPEKGQELLFTEAVFSGPILLAVILSILMRRVEARRTMVVFQVGYIFITLAICYLTFAGEHDAQYQLALLFIPLIGFPGVVVAGLVAALAR